MSKQTRIYDDIHHQLKIACAEDNSNITATLSKITKRYLKQRKEGTQAFQKMYALRGAQDNLIVAIFPSEYSALSMRDLLNGGLKEDLEMMYRIEPLEVTIQTL